MKGLINSFKPYFDPEVQRRGDESYSGRQFKLKSSGMFAAEATVNDSEEHLVQLEWALDQKHLSAYCQCDEFEAYGPCRHLWAVMRHLETTEFYVPGDNRQVHLQGAFQPFLNMPNHRKVAVGLSTWSASDHPSSALDVLGGLQRKISSEQNHHFRSKNRGGAQRELWYALNLEASRKQGAPVIELFQRKLGPRGWSPINKLSSADPITLAEFHLDDQQVFKLLERTDPELKKHRFFTDFRNQRLFGIELPVESYERILSILSSTGRLVVKQGQEARPNKDPLHIETGAQIKVQLRRHSDAEFTLKPFIQQGERAYDIFDNDVLALKGGLIYKNQKLVLTNNPDLWPLVEELKSAAREVSENELAEVLIRLLYLAPLEALDLEPELIPQVKNSSPVLNIEIQEPQFQETSLRFFFSLAFNYADVHSTRSPWYPYNMHNEEDASYIPRDFSAEKQLRRQLEELCTVDWLDKNQMEGLATTDNAEEFFNQVIAQNWQVFVENHQVQVASSSSFKIQSSGLDWFDVKAELKYGNHNFTLEEFLKLQKQNRQFIMLGDGQIGLLPQSWLQQVARASSIGSINDGQLGLSSNQLAFISDGEEFYGLQDLKARERIKHYDSLRALDVRQQPEGIEGTLREYQKKGLDWLIKLYESGFGGCLADDMGLGKTIQVLAFMEYLKSQGQLQRPNLLVVPRSLVHNWQKEASVFAPGLRVLDYSQSGRSDIQDEFEKVDLVITTYGIARRDWQHLKDMSFHLLILDEAQAIKNAKAKTYRALKGLKAAHRLVVTGTPIENHLREFISLFDLLNPGMLGPSFKKTLNNEGGYDASSQTLSLFKKAASPLILRRKKEQVLKDLPAKVEQVIYCELEGKQKQMYQELKDHYRLQLANKVKQDGWERSQVQVLEGLLRLRQMACHPGLIDPSAIGQGSAKLESLIDLITESLDEGHSALVFSQFTQHLKIVAKEFEKNKIPYDYLDGQTRHRHKVIDRFQNRSEPSVFLISLKAGGTGLNLTRADYCFLLDPWWNPAAETQAIDRAHRIGQKSKVFAYRLVSRGTVEEKILELQDKKRELADSFLEPSRSTSLSNLSWKDIESILS